MTFFKFSRRNQYLCLAASLYVFSVASVLAQTPAVTVTQLPNNVFKIGTTTLNDEDLVFYRFSDGYELSAMATGVNADASVQRQFKAASVGVSAFVARKSGPIELAAGDVGNPACPSCFVPAVGLALGEHVRLRPTSWDPFVEPAAPAPLLDTKTQPNYVTPGLPWFYLPVTLKSPSPNSYAEINIPPGMTIKGAIVKGIWKEVFVNSNPFYLNNPSDPDVLSFWYPTPGKIRITTTANYNNEFNVYLLVKSSTTLGQSSNFSAQMYNSNGNAVGTSSQIKLITHQNPHDPNLLTAFQNTSCFLQTNNPPLDFMVDFQNLGAGLAEIVKVEVIVDPKGLDPSTLTTNMISSSHPLSSVETTPTLITFTFRGINLVGLNQDPQPRLEDTKGWVQFAVDTKDCIPQNIISFKTSAQVTFTGNAGNFNETIQTNSTTHTLRECAPDPLCNDRSSWVAPQPVPVVKCYPSIIDNIVHIEAPAPAEDGSLSILMSDLSGKLWLQKTVYTTGGVDTKDALDTTTLPNGMYLVQVRAGKDVQVFKIIKE